MKGKITRIDEFSDAISLNIEVPKNRDSAKLHLGTVEVKQE